MRILVACEFSGIVRDAFIKRGHDAVSCDLLSSERLGPHIQEDVLLHLEDGWDMMIAHPPCTFLCGMGIWWNHKRPERWAETRKAYAFVRALYDSAIPRVAIENPTGWMNSHWRKPNQTIYPWQYGHEVNKPTGLWLKNLPVLKPTEIVGRGKFYVSHDGSRRWSKALHFKRGSVLFAREKSRTYPGIADAMAEQWGSIT